jgi:hypothetical protein
VTGTKKSQHFGGAKESAKLVRAIANAVRRARLDYEGFSPGVRPGAEGNWGCGGRHARAGYRASAGNQREEVLRSDRPGGEDSNYSCFDGS